MKRILFLLALVALLSGAALADSLYPTTISDLNTTVRLHGYGSISGLKDGEEVTFQTLTFQDSQFQKVSILEEALYINRKTIRPNSKPGTGESGYFKDEFGNKYVKFIIKDNGDFNYELVAHVQTSAKLYALTDYNLSDVPEDIRMYTEPSEKVESDSTEIITVARSKLTKKSFLSTLNDTISWVNGYVEYAQGTDFQRYYLLQMSAIETLLDRKGVCDEFSNLAAALLRAKGIPTRLAIGITYDGEQWGNHAWIEVYNKDIGWIPSDPTFRETGFVDGTHLRIGAFSDVTLSLAKALFPKTATVYFQTQTIPEVTIDSKSYFGNVSLTSLTSELKANRWNDYRISVKNNTGSALIVPLSIRGYNNGKWSSMGIQDSDGTIRSYLNVLVEDSKKNLDLASGESGEALFRIYPKVDLENNEKLTGFSITVNTLSSPQEQPLAITASAPINNGTVNVLDITPIASMNKLKLVISVGNYFSEEKAIDINVLTDSNAFSWQEKVPPLSEQTYTKEVPFYEETEYRAVATTPTEQYTQYIYPVMERVHIISDENGQTATVIQKIDQPKQGAVESFFQKPEVIVVILLAGVAVLLFALFLTRKRYV